MIIDFPPSSVVVHADTTLHLPSASETMEEKSSGSESNYICIIL